MKRWGRIFVKGEDGYVAVLTLISMPFIAMLALLMWDVGRGNNLHTDLQNAVDAIALAGARELDGSPSAISRAESVMTDLLQNQARFSDQGRVVMDADRVVWAFLHSIPAHDDTPLDDTYITNVSEQAAYVWVRSLEQPMESWFMRVAGVQQNVAIGAQAVATYTMAACDVTPIFMCNPFEGQTPSIKQRFASGDLYARQFRMDLAGSSSAGPGNFGFLRFGGGNGAAALGRAMATSHSDACYTDRNLETEPGVSLGQAIPGINTRFGIYEGAMGGNRTDYAYRPALNTRKGASNPNQCGNYSVESDPNQARPLPEGTLTTTFPGGTLHSADWSTELEDYWRVNHPAHVSGGTVNIPNIPRSGHPVDGTGVWPPSRHDIYRYEIDQTYGGGQNLLADANFSNPAGHTSPNGERGVPRTGAAQSCYNGPPLGTSDATDRRIIFSAIVNCNAANAAGELNGQKTISAQNVVGFATMFLTRPALHSGSNRHIYMELVDFTGEDGAGTLDLFLRQEAYLVR